MTGKATTALTETPSPNGHVMPGFVVTPRHEWVSIQTGPYAGARFRMWVNHPMHVWRGVFAQKEEERIAASTAIFLEHDHWGELNAAGEFVEYPPLSDFLAWEQAIPQDLANAMINTALVVKRGLPFESFLPKIDAP
jgi:hypothetical protein